MTTPTQTLRKPVTLIVFVVILVLGASWLFVGDRLPRRSHPGFDPVRNTLPPETKKVLDEGEHFYLLSLHPRRLPVESDPSPSPRETFHGYAVLGKTEIQDRNARTELLRALYKGIGDSDGRVASCFNPRHGISATLAGEAVDLVICFECYSISTHAKHGRGVLTTRSPQQTFDRTLERARLPLAKEE